jgi:hypothetical protein
LQQKPLAARLPRMAYEIRFTKNFTPPDPSLYNNNSCWGGDLVTQQLLPDITPNFEDVESGQEDWGWFIWCWHDKVRLEINIICDAPQTGGFRIQLYANKKTLPFLTGPENPEELEKIRQLVCTRVEAWAGSYTIEQMQR